MAKRTKNDKQSNQELLKRFFKSNATHTVAGLIIVAFAVFAFISIASFFFTGDSDQSIVEGGNPDKVRNWAGQYGAGLGNLFVNKWFGVASLLLIYFIACVGLRLMKVKYIPLVKKFIVCVVFTFWTSIALDFYTGRFFNREFFLIGGRYGEQMSYWFFIHFKYIGTTLVLLLVLIIMLIFINRKTIAYLSALPFLKRNEQFDLKNDEEAEKDEENTEKKTSLFGWLRRKKKTETDSAPEKIVETPAAQDITEQIDIKEIKKDKPKSASNDPDFIVTVANEDDSDANIVSESPLPPRLDPLPVGEEEEDLVSQLGVYDPKADLSHYRYPLLDLLQKYENTDKQIDMDEQTENKSRIIRTFEEFGIGIQSIKATVGPTVTLYEIVQAPGIRVNKIRGLSDDIGQKLKSQGIRIIAPLPNKETIGIEVPNKDPQIVSMQSILSSRKFQETKYELPVALGRTITNEVFMVDLIKMPHLLVAGATGQGKSVGLNAIITSLLYKKHPAELKFVLIDPKMVEFSLYSVIEKHFLAKLPDTEEAIITDFTKVIYTLNSLCIEMDDRYELLKKAGCRQVQEYNEKFINRRLNPMKGHRFMPYIVVVIDEYGDLIMTAGKEIESPITRIAQKARAVGMHMIIATQRPTVKIITGTIKANFPARIAFRVITAIDSRTILDNTGANQLVGRGDMLYFQGSDTTRIQCAFVDTPEVERIAKYIGTQQGYPDAMMLPEYVGADGGDSINKEPADLSKLDAMFEESARVVVVNQSGSTSLIQRRLSLGYARSGRIMDQLELAGIVGPNQGGGKPREVYIQDEYSLEQRLREIREGVKN